MFGGRRRSDHPAVKNKRPETGAAVVELAFVLPILVLLLFGIVEFGRGYNAKIQLTAAVREGARAAALGKNASAVESATKAAATGLNPTKVTVTSATCTTGTADAQVTATYPFTYDIPLFGRRTSSLSATGVMRCGA